MKRRAKKDDVEKKVFGSKPKDIPEGYVPISSTRIVKKEVTVTQTENKQIWRLKKLNPGEFLVCGRVKKLPELNRSEKVLLRNKEVKLSLREEYVLTRLRQKDKDNEIFEPVQVYNAFVMSSRNITDSETKYAQALASRIGGYFEVEGYVVSIYHDVTNNELKDALESLHKDTKEFMAFYQRINQQAKTDALTPSKMSEMLDKLRFDVSDLDEMCLTYVEAMAETEGLTEQQIERRLMLVNV